MIVTRGRGPGQWWPLKLDDSGRMSAEFYCPNCRLACSMVNHAISPDGTVTPSFVECADKVRCGTFHQNLKLEGWGQ